MKKYLIPVLLGLMVILAGCGNDSASNEINIKEYVSELSASNIAESASINDKELIVQDSKDEEIYDLPKDEFFVSRSEEHTSELQSRGQLVCRLLLEKKKKKRKKKR